MAATDEARYVTCLEPNNQLDSSDNEWIPLTISHILATDNGVGICRLFIQKTFLDKYGTGPWYCIGIETEREARWMAVIRFRFADEFVEFLNKFYNVIMEKYQYRPIFIVSVDMDDETYTAIRFAGLLHPRYHGFHLRGQHAFVTNTRPHFDSAWHNEIDLSWFNAVSERPRETRRESLPNIELPICMML